jgi:hypothetical protein
MTSARQRTETTDFRKGFAHRTREYVMGEARRRMRVAAIGAETSWSDDHRKAAIRQPKFITIGELEDMARTYMADDPVTFVPAKVFVLERQEQLMSDGSVKVHPDPPRPDDPSARGGAVPGAPLERTLAIRPQPV